MSFIIDITKKYFDMIGFTIYKCLMMYLVRDNILAKIRNWMNISTHMITSDIVLKLFSRQCLVLLG